MIQDIVVTYSDTDHGINGTGPGGSRFTVMVAGAVVGAAQQLKEKLIRVAAHMMEADDGYLEFARRQGGVKGVPAMEKTFPEVAPYAHFRLSMPDGPSFTSGLDAKQVYDHPVTTLPSPDRRSSRSTSIPVRTGSSPMSPCTICGTLVKPMTLAGHVRGGVAQGIGTALYERYYYDDNCQLLTATFMDYLIPTCVDAPCGASGICSGTSM